MDPTRFFGEQDLQDIKAAVQRAEQATSGEIVPCVVGRSASYDETGWRGATFGALGFALAAALVHHLAGVWGLASWLWLVGPPVAGAALGFVLGAFVPAVKRLLVHPDDLARQVRERASVAFLEHEVFDTRERTGILIFLSLFERRVVVLGDSGINARVEQPEWDGLVAELAAGIKARRAAAALVAAIGTCGELLERRGVAIRPDDTDELRDDLRIEKE
jgi:putative membrane protein